MGRKKKHNKLIFVYAAFVKHVLSSSQNSRISSNNNRNPLEEAFMKESSSSSSEMKFPVLDGDFPSEREGQEKFAQTMTTISPEERARVLDDLHGVSAETEETPEFLAKHLLLFEQEVERQKVAEEALALALTKDPAYVGSQKIRLQFLRSESFRVPAAVARFARHFKLKQELFGVEKLTKDITQDDLDEETMRLLYGGRTNSKENDATCLMRRLYYIAMVSVESIEAQKKGVVIIYWSLGRSKVGVRFSARSFWNAGSLQKAVPMRVLGFHFCYNSILLRPIVSAIQLGFDFLARTRLRSHYGPSSILHQSLAIYIYIYMARGLHLVSYSLLLLPSLRTLQHR
eukprot:scaffold8587_cov97-Cylindrotheca_fusiformis.AAC.5